MNKNAMIISACSFFIVLNDSENVSKYDDFYNPLNLYKLL